MLSGFCFGQDNTAVEVLEVNEDDFCLLLMEHMKREEKKIIAMDLETKCNINHGVADMVRNGFKIVVVDPNYTPIKDKIVLPLNVHRDIHTLRYHFPDAVCVGRLLIQLNNNSYLDKLHVVSGHGSESNILNYIPLSKMGWSVNSITENEVSLTTNYSFNPNNRGNL